MTTTNQTKWLEALTAKIKGIDDPNPEIILPYSYKWKLTTLKSIGGVPKISFSPYGCDTQIKAEIMRNAGITPSDDWLKKRECMRAKFGIKKADGQEDRELAVKFNNFSIEYWSKIRSAILLLQDVQMRFCKDGQTLAGPVQLIITDILPGFQSNSESEPNSQESD